MTTVVNSRDISAGCPECHRPFDRNRVIHHAANCQLHQAVAHRQEPKAKG